MPTPSMGGPDGQESSDGGSPFESMAATVAGSTSYLGDATAAEDEAPFAAFAPGTQDDFSASGSSNMETSSYVETAAETAAGLEPATDPVPPVLYEPASTGNTPILPAPGHWHSAPSSVSGPMGSLGHTPVFPPPPQAQWPFPTEDLGPPGPPNPPAADAALAGGVGMWHGLGEYAHVPTQTHTHTHTHTHIHAHTHATHAHVHTQVHHHHSGYGFGMGVGPGPVPGNGAAAVADYTAGALAQIAASVYAVDAAMPPATNAMFNVLSPFQLYTPPLTYLGTSNNNLTPQNVGLKGFLDFYSRRLVTARRMNHLRPPDVLSSVSISHQMNNPLRHITEDKLDGDRCDMQGVDWTQLGISRDTARYERKVYFQNFVSIPRSDRWKPSADEKMLSSHETYFRFRRMHIKKGIFLPHFQLRNLLACNSRTRAYYADRGGVVQQFNPLTGLSKPVMRFQNQSSVMLSTIASGQSMLVAGGFCGEYCVANMDSEYVDEAPFENCFEGSAISAHGSDSEFEDNTSGITNHIEVHSLRNAGGPLAAFASNDKGLRILDLNTQKLLSTVMFDFAPNCTAISPDRRLRVVVGDRLHALIVAADPERSKETEGGGTAPEILQELTGHKDFGFSCAWAPDGYTLATGNQDRAIKIWDARKWCDTRGRSTPVITVRTQMSGARSLHFTPAGSGSRLLVVGEEADFVTVINAQTFRAQQSIDMFGELAGVALTDDGQDLFALCADPWRGGVLQFERSSASEHLDDNNLEDAFEPYSARRAHRNSAGPPDWTPVGSGDFLGGHVTPATAAALAQQARRQQRRQQRQRLRATSRAGLDPV